MAESRTLKRLAHPNIVKYIGSFRDKKEPGQDESAGFFYIVMEHLGGGGCVCCARAERLQGS